MRFWPGLRARRVRTVALACLSVALVASLACAPTSGARFSDHTEVLATWKVKDPPPLNPKDLPGKTMWLKGSLVCCSSGVTDWGDGAVTDDPYGSANWPDDYILIAEGGEAEADEGPHRVRVVRLNSFNDRFPIPPRVTRPGMLATSITREDGANIVDGDLTTGEDVPNIGSYPVTVNLSTPKALTQYSLAPKAGAEATGPKAWTLAGSVNGTSGWVTLDSQTNQTFAAGQLRTFTFPNSTAYKAYRLTLTSFGTGSTAKTIGEFVLPGVTDAYATAGDLWIVAKADTGATASALYQFGTATDDPANGYPHNASTVYDSFGTATRQSFTPTMPLDQWRIIRVHNDGNVYEYSIDGVVQKRVTGLPVKFSPHPLLGATTANGTTGQYFKGMIAEVLFLPRVTTPAEAAGLVRYFNQEYDLSVTP